MKMGSPGARLLDIDSRLRVARVIGKDETQTSSEVLRLLQQRGHLDDPLPVISDGSGGINEAMVKVYGCIPEHSDRGCPPTRKKPGSDWIYLQMVKQRDEYGRFQGTKLRVIFGTKAKVVALLGKGTACIERSKLTIRLFNSRQVHKNLAFSKDIHAYRAAAMWDNSY